MEGITEEKLTERYGQTIGRALYAEMSKAMGETRLSEFTIIDGYLDMQAKVHAVSLGVSLEINHGREGVPPIDGDQMAGIIGALGRLNDREIDR